MTIRAAPVAAALVVALVAGISWARHTGGVQLRSWDRLEASLLDTWFTLRPPLPASGDVVVVTIDDATIQAHPELIERRVGIASFVERLEQQGARAVAYDFLLVDPERLLPEPLADDLAAWQAAPDPDTPVRARELLARAHEVTRGDEVLEQTMREADTELILGFHLGRRAGSGQDTRSLSRGAYGQVVPGPHLPTSADAVLASLPAFNRAADRLGVVTIHEDASGQVRAAPLGVRSGERVFVPLGVQLAAAHQGVPRGRMVFRGDDGSVQLGDRRIQADDNRLWLNWLGDGVIPEVSALDVWEGRAGEQLRGRVAVVGYTHLAQDSTLTPWGSRPAVLVHATLAENLLADTLLRRAPLWLELLWTLGLGGLVVLGFLFRSPLVRLAGVGAAGAAAVALPPAAFLVGATWLGAVGAVLAVAGGAMVGFAAGWLQEGREARALQRAFASYVSDELLGVMIADPSLVRLRGQRRELSVLFSDIRDFTTYSERIEPLVLIGFLNHYLAPMTRAVKHNRGFVDKFMGDAVMALFGAPVPIEAHAACACRAALDMYAGLDEVRPEASRLGIELAIGVGVNTGEVAVGNMGSDDRLEYTVLGDAVNLASRLEGLTKTYGVFCLVGPATAAAAGDAFVFRSVDLVRVKGKREPVEVFELCGDARTVVATYAGTEQWEAAMSAWRAARFDEARAAFASFREQNPDDPVVALYLQRLAELGDVAPAGWDGVFTHTLK